MDRKIISSRNDEEAYKTINRVVCQKQYFDKLFSERDPMITLYVIGEFLYVPKGVGIKKYPQTVLKSFLKNPNNN